MNVISSHPPRVFGRLASRVAAALLLVLGCGAAGALHAEGVKNLTRADTDPALPGDTIVMLETGRPGFGGFADFNGPTTGRLVVSIAEVGEVVYFGLSPEHDDFGQPFDDPRFSRYRFRVRRILPNGNIASGAPVHGPFIITNSNANVANYAQAEFGNYRTDTRSDGNLIYEFRPTAPGDYSIEFDEFTGDGNAKVNIPYWDVTVEDTNGDVAPGRLWSRNWALRTPTVDDVLPECVWDRPFHGTIYSYTEDGFTSKVDFLNSGFQGLSFNIAFNSTGPGQTGDLAEDRKSIPNTNATQNAAEHRIFLELPDRRIFPDGMCGEVTADDAFTCNGPGEYCLNVSVTQPGQVQIVLDFDGDGLADDNGVDRILVVDFAGDDLDSCIIWDGLRGDSVPITFTDTVDIIITYGQGVQHWAAFDLEFVKQGYCVTTERPLCARDPDCVSLFWDDSNITDLPGTGAEQVQLEGCTNGSRCRNWNNFRLGAGEDCDNFRDANTSGYGDKNTINTYWFANSQVAATARVPVVSAVIEGPSALCEGQTSVLRAEDRGIIGAVNYRWSGPGVDGATTDTVVVSQAGEYCVTITSVDNGCDNQTCVTVDVLDFDTDFFPGQLDICFGDSVQITPGGNPDFTYQWSPATGISSTTSPRPTFFPTETTVYSVTISSQNADAPDCSTTQTVTVAVSPDLNLSVTGGGPLCEETTSITATTDRPATIELFGPDGALLGTGTDFDLSVSGTTDYLLRATDAANGCQDSVVFTVSGGPVSIAAPDTVLSCTDETLNLSVTNLDANDTLSYAWSPADLFDPATVNAPNPTFTAGPGDYLVTVTATNQFGCVASEDVRVVLLDEDGLLDFSANIDCDGQTVRFSNLSTMIDFGFVYDFGDGTSSTEASPVHVYPGPGTYTVTLDLIYDQDCIASVMREVTTLDATLVAGFTTAIGDCDNGTASVTFTDNSFNATGTDLTYNWTFTGATPASSSEASPTVTVTESGTVVATLDLSSADGCTALATDTVTVNLANVNLADSLVICPGDSAALNPGGDAALSYAWAPSPDFAADAVNPVTRIPGTYSVTVTAAGADLNCETVDQITVVVADSIGLVLNGPDGPIAGGGGAGGNGGDDDSTLILPTLQTCGEPVSLTTTLSVDQGVNVVFTAPDGTVLGTGNQLTLSGTGRDTVTATATNEFGCTEQVTVVIISNQIDAELDVDGEGIDVCAAQDTTVGVINNRPGDTLTYDWAANDIINGRLDSAGVRITTPAEGSVDLMVTVTNQFGCDTTLTVTVTATPFIPNQFAPTLPACFGEPTVISGGEAVDGYVYEWDPAEGLDLSDPANPVGTFTEDTDLSVTITDPATGCSLTQDVAVEVAPEIGLMVNQGDTSVCGPTEFRIVSTVVNADATVVYSDDRDFGNVIGTGETFDLAVDDATGSRTIYVQAGDPESGCTVVDSVTIDFVPFMPVNYPPVVLACFDQTTTITSEGEQIAGYTYEWSPAGALDDPTAANPTGTFTEDTELTVTVTDPATGCSADQVVLVNAQPEISLVANPADTTICNPAMVTVGGSSVNDDVDFTWFADEALTQELATGSSYVVDAADPGQAYTVFLRGRDRETGCEEVVTVTVNVSGLQTGLPLTDVDLCAGDQPSIFGPGGPNANFTYVYEPANLVDDSDPDNPVFVGTEDATVNVTVTDPATGCTATTPVNFGVTTIGPLTGMADPAIISAGGSSILTVTGCDDDCTIDWDGPSGPIEPASGPAVTVTPDDTGDLVYTYTATKNGCTEDGEIELRVDPTICDEDQIYLPNAFTPNGDNVNDVIRVRSRFADQLTEFRWIIYDRWGQEVFSTDNIEDAWDGTKRGDSVEPDVFGYWLRATCPDGEPYIQQGNISVLR